MLFVHQAGAGLLLVILTLWTQSAGSAALIARSRHALTGDIRKLGPIHSAGLMVQLTTAIVVLQAINVLLWASCYRWLCFPSWESALYFSATSYSTVGYGDVVLPREWRMLGPLESIIGVLMCGISISFLYAVVTRLVGRRES